MIVQQPQDPPAPRQLLIVAQLFIVFGMLAIIQMVADTTVFHRIDLNFAALQLPMGYGIRARQWVWRDLAMVINGLGLLGLLFTLSIAPVSYFFGPIGFFGIPIIVPDRFEKPVVVGVLALSAIFTSWVIWVLTRPQAKAYCNR